MALTLRHHLVLVERSDPNYPLSRSRRKAFTILRSSTMSPELVSHVISLANERRGFCRDGKVMWGARTAVVLEVVPT